MASGCFTIRMKKFYSKQIFWGQGKLEISIAESKIIGSIKVMKSIYYNMWHYYYKVKGQPKKHTLTLKAEPKG